MDFFQHQEQARRNTTKLVVLFALAVLGIIAAVYTVFTAVFATASARAGEAPSWWDPEVFAMACAGTLMVVGFGSLYKISQLRSGGPAVASMLGGRLVQSNTRDRLEKILINVVEEIAIASGTPVPQVYLMEGEPGINAFAAGFAPGDAVIGVTRGCLEQLTRDELQGVVAHEFSHVLNGDMRLNIRLMGVLHGILCVGLAGYVILRSGAGFRTRNNRGNGAAILIFGVALIAIGYIGMFFAKLIQAAVSRQREFLADASAVQFTRNPRGIAGALKKIGGFAEHGEMKTPQAAAASHLFFGNALKPQLLHALATHPPLDERIRRIDRTFQTLADAGTAAAPAAAGLPAAAAGFAGATPRQVVESTGTPTDAHLAHTRQMIGSLPLAVQAAMHEPFVARALIYALLLDRKPNDRRDQLDRLHMLTDKATVHEVMMLAPHVDDLDPSTFLPLVDLSMPALREMSEPQYRAFSRLVRVLIEADERVTLFEFALQKVLLRHLATSFERPPRTAARYHSMSPLLDACQVLLSRLARVGQDDDAAVGAAYEAGIAALPHDGYARPLLEVVACQLTAVDRALDKMAQSTPPCKQWILRACAETVAHDGEIRPREVELLRAIADTLDCPMPPLLREAQ